MTSGNLSAIIVGSGGQDGVLLTEYLMKLGYIVYGVKKNDIDISDPISVNKLISEIHPREVYFLAAYHHSSEDVPENEGDLFRKSFSVHTISAINFLDAIANFSPESRFFYASSCLIFAATEEMMQTENTAFSPETPYAMSKVAGMNACQHYKNKKGVFACSGILYNHESPLRSLRFVTRKIAQAAAKISIAREGDLVLGSLEAKVDWGYAPDFVVAMHKMLQLDKPEDFIVATGESHTVREFAKLAFKHVGLNYLDYVSEKPSTLSRSNFSRIGDPTRLKQRTNWKPTISLEQMVKLMVDAELFSSETN
jgi:GDPmannose 4,6-dehydratase